MPNNSELPTVPKIRLITSFSVLMRYAWELGDARLSKDAARIAAATRAHDDYRDMCLKSEMMLTHRTLWADCP